MASEVDVLYTLTWEFFSPLKPETPLIQPLSSPQISILLVLWSEMIPFSCISRIRHLALSSYSFLLFYMLVGSIPCKLLSLGVGLSIYKTVQRHICVRGTRTLAQGCITVHAVCFSLASHPLPSLINNYLKLSAGTQERSGRLNEAYFL